MLSYCSAIYDSVRMNAISAINFASHYVPLAVDYAIVDLVRAGFQNEKVGRALGGASVFFSGSYLIAKSDVCSDVRSYFHPADPQQSKSGHHKLRRWALAGAGLCLMIYGANQVAMAIFEPAAHENPEKYLLCHDNRVKQDEKAGRSLARLSAAHYYSDGSIDLLPVVENRLARSNDLESLKWIEGNDYMTCESTGNCTQFTLEMDAQGRYETNSFRVFQLDIPVPKGIFYNVEALECKKEKDHYVFYWSHRGGIYAGEEPWMCRGIFNFKTRIITDVEKFMVEDPFWDDNPYRRAISDHAIGPISGDHYFIGTIDTSGSEGIAATDDDFYSILYKEKECLARFPNEKVEGLHVSVDEKSVIFTTDNESDGSKICRYVLKTGVINCNKVREGEEYGVGGIAPIKI